MFVLKKVCEAQGCPREIWVPVEDVRSWGTLQGDAGSLGALWRLVFLHGSILSFLLSCLALLSSPTHCYYSDWVSTLDEEFWSGLRTGIAWDSCIIETEGTGRQINTLTNKMATSFPKKLIWIAAILQLFPRRAEEMAQHCLNDVLGCQKWLCVCFRAQPSATTLVTAGEVQLKNLPERPTWRSHGTKPSLWSGQPSLLLTWKDC